MKLTSTFLAMLLLALSVMSTPAEAQHYRLRAGDTLRLEVLEDSSLNRDVLVAPDGNITVPLVGVVRVGGFTINQATARIRSGLASNFETDPSVSVSLINLGERRAPAGAAKWSVYVIGEVNKPGELSITPGTSLLQTLSVAGGLTDFAAAKRIQLRRSGKSGEQVYRFNYDAVLKGHPNIGTTTMADGDVIVVPQRGLFE